MAISWSRGTTRFSQRSRKRPRRQLGLCPLGAPEALERRELLTVYTVDLNYDIVDPNDGLTSFREALNAANANPDHDRIEFDPSLRFSVIHKNYVGIDEEGFLVQSPTNPGSFTVSSDVTIDATSAGLVRIGHERGFTGFYGRIFHVLPGANVELINTIVQGGEMNGDLVGGVGIWNEGQLTLRNTVVGSNIHRSPNWDDAVGAGIRNAPTGDLTLINSHVGEILLNSDFLSGIGIDGEFYITEEVRERNLPQPFVVTLDHPLKDNGTDDPARISGNISRGRGAGIYNEGTAQLLDGSTVEGNRGKTEGAGIYNAASATLLIEDSHVVRNGVELSTNGGGIFNAGDLTIVRSQLTGNLGTVGGAISNVGQLSIIDSELTDNNAATPGYAFTPFDPPSGGALYDNGTSTTITNSTFASNHATVGGAIHNVSNANLQLTQVTISGNVATMDGGGLANASGAATMVQLSTIANNTAGAEGGGIWGPSGMTIGASILADNIAPVGPDFAMPGASASFTNQGQNLISDSSGSGFTTGGSDLVDVAAHLGPLGNYGGATRTHGLQASSPAINSVDPNEFAPVLTLAHQYDLNGSLTDAFGGPSLTISLTSLGGTLTASEYQFSSNAGLDLAGAITDPEEYAIEMRVKVSSVSSGFQKLIDFADLSSDAGLYVNEDGLVFYPYGISAPGLQANQFYDIRLERDKDTKEIRVLRDGQVVIQTTDVNDDAVASAPNQMLHFFHDDTFTNLNESAEGAVDWIRIDNSFPFMLPETDQRGEPRQVGHAVDRGAFESQPPSSMRVDTLSGINDGYYAEGEFSLVEAIEWANLVPGADTISLSEDLVTQLQASPGTIDTLSEIRITDDLTIVGPGAELLAVSGMSDHRVLAIAAGASVSISGLTLSDGYHNQGGAGILNEGTLTLDGVVVADNQSLTAGSVGGGIDNRGALELRNSSVIGSSAYFGGGLYTDGPATISNSTFSNNVAINGTSGGDGAGIYANTGIVEIVHTTIADNRALRDGGGIFNASATVSIANSIVSNNESNNGNIVGDVSQLGNNLTVNQSFLGDLGGPIPVHGLLPGSNAIGAADPNFALPRDQLGTPRPLDIGIDLGAVEYQIPALANPIVVDTLSGKADGYYAPGNVSLPEAILFANDSIHHNAIVFAPHLFVDDEGQPLFDQVIPLGGRLLDIATNMTITGPGADQLRVSADGLSGVARVQAGVTAVIAGLTLTNGDFVTGGAILNEGTLTLNEVYLENNAAENGGAIYNMGQLTINASTISHNSAINGGGIYSDGDATIVNSTLSGNTAIDLGGGVYNRNAGDDLLLTHTTITNNTALFGGGIYNNGHVNLASSVVAQNTGLEVGHDGYNSGAGTLSSGGGNVIGDNTEFGMPLGSGDQFGTVGSPIDPLLTDLLKIAGTRVPMHGLLPGSPAEDTTPATSPVNVDQRGEPRSGLRDAGAFEIQPLPFDWTTELVVNNTTDIVDANYDEGNLTLREAILLANFTDGSQIANDQDRIRFADELVDAARGESPDAVEPVTIELGGAPLALAGSIVIDPFADGTLRADAPAELFQISAGGLSRVIVVPSNPSSNVQVDLRNLTLKDGSATGNGGAVQNFETLTLDNVHVLGSDASGLGGAISNDAGTLNISDTVIAGNHSDLGGGGLFNAPGTTLELSRSTIANNVTAGATARLGGGLRNDGTAHVERSTFVGNFADYLGSAIQNHSILTLENSTVSNNGKSATGVLVTRGAVFNATGATMTISNTTVAENDAQREAGIRNNGTMTLVNSISANNRVTFDSPDGFNAGSLTAFNNLIGNNSTSNGTFVPTGNGNLLNISNPGLSPLANNGGPTLTHGLLATSPALDAGNPNYAPLVDQRGRPLVDLPEELTPADPDVSMVDIGSFEVQQIASSSWRYEQLDQSQFGPGSALVFGFGFDEGDPNSSVKTDPKFLGFEFDTGKMTFGHIADGEFDTKFGGELTADFSGKLGFDVGFYVNSGSLDLIYDGEVGQVIEGTGNSAQISTSVSIDDGSLYTVSPKIGAYADLILELDADVSATGCVFGCVEADLIDVHFAAKQEMFAINRQMADDAGRPMFLDDFGEGVARDTKTGKFYNIDGQEIPNPGV
ncbi:MAG: hypothetical protein KDA60_00035, partial [Planctomycetales bacterium]|nr:hypothetical protein [Planctomycetales bacterium]